MPQLAFNPTEASNQETAINILTTTNVPAGTLTPTGYETEEISEPKSLKPKFLSSAVTSLEYPRIVETIPKYEISKEAEVFIFKQKKAVRYKKDLVTICDRIAEFLQKANIEAEISISLFQDPEYSDWVESKIIIGVNEKEFAKAYELYGNLLDYSLGKIRRKTIEKVVIAIAKR